MHWVDVIAKDLLERSDEHVIASGTSISGQIHIGNAGDVIIAEGVARSLIEQGARARVIWIMDDMDPLRSVPEQLPPEFKDYLGMPDVNLPCPTGNCGSFVEHFTGPFLNSLKEVGVEPEVISSAAMYNEGRYADITRKALGRALEIKEILRSISGSEKPETWLPFDPVCENCGRITTTNAYEYLPPDQVKYRCTQGVAGRKVIKGCGHEGVADITQGKLTWRVEWGARWKEFEVTCEPFGKEHAAAGGSYDTSSEIVRKVYDYPAPLPVKYEFILVGGKKMSKSLGNVLTLRELIDVATPEVARYFFFRSKASKHKDFDINKNLLPLIEEYEITERVYFDKEDSVKEKEVPDIKRSYQLSQIERVPETFFQVPFTHLISVVQIDPEFDGILDILKRNEDFTGYTAEHEERLRIKIDTVKRWLEDLAPEHMKFSVQKKVPGVELSDEEKAFLSDLSGILEGREWSPDQIHDGVYTTATEKEFPPRKGFKAVYKAILGQGKGPRLGYFLASLEKDWVLKRLKLEE